jgi:hypothetical protein
MSKADTNRGVNKPCTKEDWEVSEGLMHFRTTSDEFGCGTVEGNIVAFFYGLDVMVTKCVLTAKMINIKVAEGD